MGAPARGGDWPARRAGSTVPGMTFTVRPIEQRDLEATAKLAGALIRLHHEWDPARFFVVRGVEAGYARFLATEMKNPDAVVLVAVQGDEARVVGYAYASLEERNWSDLRDACGKLHDVFVDEAARGGGVAAALVEESVKRLRAMGAPRVVLMTATKNEAGRRLFARLGFRETMIEMTRETP